MKIGLVTNWNERCAVAEYARNLTEYVLKVDKEVEFKVIGRPLDYKHIFSEIKDVDVLHFNYCAHAFSALTPSDWFSLGLGLPVIMTVHESSDYFVRRLAKQEIADVYVMHDRFRDGMPWPANVVAIPYGVPEVDVSDVEVERKVGTFGCAFPWKGLLPLAYACSQLNLPLDMHLSEPDSDKGQLDWARTLSEIRSLHPITEIWTEWKPQEEIIRRLASCAVIALPFDPCSPITGISASVRLALAAMRPLVLTKFFHFADLVDGFGITWIQNGNGLGSAIKNAMFENVSPVRLYNEMRWTVAAQKYAELYKKVATKEEVNAG